MRVQLAGVGKQHGAQVILDEVTLTIGPRARIGLVGPNGVGKTTLLRIVAGHEPTRRRNRDACTRAADASGTSRRSGTSSTAHPCSTSLARRAGIEDAERELEASARALAEGEDAEDRYATALDRLVALGAESFEARARATCADLGLGVDLDRELVGPLRRRGGAGRARRHPALALRRAAPGRADERPRLRRPRAARAVPRRLSRRARRRLARSRVPRSHGHGDRVDRAGHAPAPRVGGRLQRLRGRP